MTTFPAASAGRSEKRRLGVRPGRVAVALLAWLASSFGPFPEHPGLPPELALPGRAWSQERSLLDDVGTAEPPFSAEEPPLQQDTTEGPSPANGSQPSDETDLPMSLEEALKEAGPLDEGPPPEVQTGIGSLDDLVGDDGNQGDSVEVEPVYDHVLLGGGTRGFPRKRPVELLDRWVERPLPRGRDYIFTIVYGDSLRRKVTVPGRQIANIQYYEQRMLERAADELAVRADVLAHPLTVEELARRPLLDLSSPAQRRKAERVIALLQTALAEHDSAVQRRLRRDPRFAGQLRQPLVEALFHVQISQLRLLMDSRNYPQALLACDRLNDQYPEQSRQRLCLRQLVEKILLEPAEAALSGGDYATARQQLADYQTRFPNAPGERAVRIRQTMMGDARTLAERARKLAQQDRHQEALVALEQATKIWPGLRGLPELKRQMKQEHPTLVCAYSQLPTNFSPLSIHSPVDRHAVALMFERLVQWREDDRVGPHFAPQLAGRRPTSIVRGRRFELPRCVWSDSIDDQPRYCTAADVVATVRLLKQLHPFGFPAAWEELLQGVETSRFDDPFTFAIRLETDHWQPLSLMDFRIVPAHRFPRGGDGRQFEAQLKNFAEETPVGTGPYRLFRKTDKSVSFLANPKYRKPALPQIQEVRFEELDDQVRAVELFRQEKVHLIYGVRREHLAQLRLLNATVHTLRTRSVSFLAPNYRRPKMQNESLRLAIAHAIDREKILDADFRPPGQALADHAAISGPYPRYALNGQDCWAYNQAVADFPRGVAAGMLARARQELGESLTPIRLSFPAREPLSERACRSIAEQLADVGLTIELDPVEPRDFYLKVMRQHDFDLVYWRHDFPDETYWIWPFFDPDDREPGGANFMGLEPPEELRQMFEDMKTHKDFRLIRQLSHQIHAYIARYATIIPLWQRDEYVAVSDRVSHVRLDPIDLFQDVEHWSLSTR